MGMVGFMEGFTPSVVEPSLAPTVYASGVAAVKVIAGVMHMLMYVEQPTIEGEVERVINLRICFPLSADGAIRSLIEKAIREANQVTIKRGGRMDTEPMLNS